MKIMTKLDGFVLGACSAYRMGYGSCDDMAGRARLRASVTPCSLQFFQELR